MRTMENKRCPRCGGVMNVRGWCPNCGYEEKKAVKYTFRGEV